MIDCLHFNERKVLHTIIKFRVESTAIFAAIPILAYPDKSHVGTRGGIRGGRAIKRTSLFLRT